MNTSDIYWLFLQKAALNEDESILSLYDKKNNQLFRFKNIDGILAPKLRNEHINHYQLEYNEIIAKYNIEEIDIYRLKAIPYNEKEEFLRDFLKTKIKDNELRKKIINLITPHNLADGGKIIIRFDLDMAMKMYDPLLNNFLKEKIYNHYYTLGINENTEVLL